MTNREERDRLKAENEPEIELISPTYFNWSWPGFGFGQLSIGFGLEGDRPRVMDERIGRENVRRILIAYANKLADVAILEGDD